MLGQIRERAQELRPVLGRLAHADDAAAAHLEPGRAHRLQRVEPVLIGARGDDLAVELRRGVEIVVVIVETGRLELGCLLRGEHSERGAALETRCAHRADHLGDHLEVARLRRAVGRAHAEAGGARGAGGGRALAHRRDLHERARGEPGVVAHALRAVGAILGTGAGLDRQQRAHLHRVGYVVRAMRALRAQDQIGERQGEERAHLVQRPVVADGVGVALDAIDVGVRLHAGQDDARPRRGLSTRRRASSRQLLIS